MPNPKHSDPKHSDWTEATAAAAVREQARLSPDVLFKKNYGKIQAIILQAARRPPGQRQGAAQANLLLLTTHKEPYENLLQLAELVDASKNQNSTLACEMWEACQKKDHLDLGVRVGVSVGRHSAKKIRTLLRAYRLQPRCNSFLHHNLIPSLV